MHNHKTEKEYKIKVYKRINDILTLFSSNVSICYLHETGNFPDNYYTGNVHLKYLRMTAELSKCNSLKLAVIKVTWPRCRNTQTSSVREEKSIHSFFGALLLQVLIPLLSDWLWMGLHITLYDPSVPDTRHKSVTSVLPKFCAPTHPHWRMIYHGTIRQGHTHTWTSALEKSSHFIWSVISWAAWDKMG